ncbi:MAG: L,D-transpeptidase family protein, partial [Alphaproteobacteria bacterium]
PSLAELAADPPSLVENGKPDPAITATRVAGALRAILTRETRSGAALAGFYGSRQFQPLFTADGLLSARGLAAANRMTQAGNDGLDPQAYRVALPEGPRTAERIAELELAVARAVALYASHASGGRTDARRLSTNFDVAPPRVDTASALSQVTAAADMAAALDGFNPPHEGFRRLRAKLAEIRADNRVAAREMSDTSATRRAIGLERDIIANLERWRWLPRELGEAHIWVNVPDYDAAIVSDGRVIHRTKTIVGRHETQTPVFSHSMSYIVFNPAWYVPHSIVRRDMVANATRDPSYFARRGIEVVRRGRVVDPATIDWSATNVGNLGFRQPPGERNALGRMKFMFPNAHAIYLHDTPNRSLFSREARAFSNGCIRVFEPERFAEVVLGLAMPGENWTQARIDTLYGPGERTVRFKRNVPIHLVYFTMDVDASGQLVQHADIYGHNARVRAALIGQRS